MKKIPIIILFFVILLANIALGDLCALPVKKIYFAPSVNSKLVYEVPINVTLLDISDDANWYKVKLAFNIGPLQYKYTGWANIPIGEVVTARLESIKQAANTPEVPEETN